MKYNDEQWQDNLSKANDMLVAIDASVELIIVGGVAFVSKNLVSRTTYDIDFINDVDKKIKDILNQFGINNRAATFIQTFGDWEDDLEDLYELSNISLKTLSTERLLVSRMLNRKRSEDFIHVFESKTDIDRNKFEKIFSEVYAYTDPIYTNELLENKEMLKSMYKKRGWDYEKSDIKKLLKK